MKAIVSKERLVQVRVAELTYGSDPELCETKVREQMKLWDLLEAFVTLD